jgi:hypothetical protein
MDNVWAKHKSIKLKVYKVTSLRGGTPKQSRKVKNVKFINSIANGKYKNSK